VALRNGCTEPFSLLVSQIVAVYLFELSVKDDVYFEEVARYAREAIAADPPEWVLISVDSGGQRSGKVNPAFEGIEDCADLSVFTAILLIL
jgi:hypothetical protein